MTHDARRRIRLTLLTLLALLASGCRGGGAEDGAEEQARAAQARPYVAFYEGLAEAAAGHAGDCEGMGRALLEHLDAHEAVAEELRGRAARRDDLLISQADEQAIQRAIGRFEGAARGCQEAPAVQRAIRRLLDPP